MNKKRVLIIVISVFLIAIIACAIKIHNDSTKYDVMITEKFNKEIKDKFSDLENVRIEEIPQSMAYNISYYGEKKLLYIDDCMIFMIYTDDVSEDLKKDKCAENIFYSDDFILVMNDENDKVLSILEEKYDKVK